MTGKQYNLSNGEKSLIAQARTLVEAKYNLNLWELRLFIDVLEQIKKEDKAFKEYRLYYKDIVAQYGQQSSDYRHIRKASITILRKVVHFDYVADDGELREFHAPVFTKVTTPKNWGETSKEKYIDFKINSDLKDQLIALQKNYLLYDKRNILKLRSKFAIRIYQILKSYERKDRDSVVVELSVKELRETLLVNDEGESIDQYKSYTLFKKKVILKAQEEINSLTDISFSIEEIKKGRRVDSIKFYLRKNRKEKQLQIETKSELEEIKDLDLSKSEQSEIFIELTKAGIHVDRAYSLMEQFPDHELLLDELRFAQKELKNAFNVKSETGFIISSIEKESFKSSEWANKQVQDKKKNKKAKQKETTELYTKQIDELRKEYTINRNRAISTLLSPYTKEEVKQMVNVRSNEKPLIRKAIEKAEEQKDKDLANEFKYGLFVVDLEDKSLKNFETYLQVKYQLRLDFEGNDQVLKEI